MLLEVVFAIALFATAAGTIMGAFSASLKGLRALRLEAQAVDRAVTLLSEIQMGLVPPIDDGPVDFEEPDQDWTWQIVTRDLDVQTLDVPPMIQVQILITYKPEAFSYSLYHLVPGSTEAVETGPIAELGLSGGAGL